MCPALTPLCPAGHLPLKRGDVLDASLPGDSDDPVKHRDATNPKVMLLVISPLEGEMVGRPEGGILPRNTTLLWEEHA